VKESFKEEVKLYFAGTREKRNIERHFSMLRPFQYESLETTSIDLRLIDQ